VKHNQSEAALAEELPYWEFFSHPKPHAVLTDGSVVAGLELGLADIECFDELATNQFAVGLRSALNGFSEGTSVQFLLRVRSDYSDVISKHCSEKLEKTHELIQKIAEFREAALRNEQNQTRLYRPQLFVFLRTKPEAPKKLHFFRKPESFTEVSSQAYTDSLEMLNQNVENLSSTLESLGIASRALSKVGLVELGYQFLNPKRSKNEPTPTLKSSIDPEVDQGHIDDANWLADSSPREQLVFGDLVLGYEQFTLDQHYHRVISLKTLPEVTHAGQLNHFLRMPFHYDLILSFDVPTQANEMSKLQQKRKMAHSLASTQSGRASDIESETKLSSTEELIRELLNTGQRIYAAELLIVLKAPSTTSGNKILNRQVRDVLSRFRSLQGAEGLEESVGAWKVLKGNLPMAPTVLERARKMKTNNLADFLPVYGPYEGDSDPVVIFRNRLNGLRGFNSFDPSLPNFNSLVTGSSGAGKSFLNNCILVQELARDLRVFIIDIGGSYKKITESLGGQYLEVNLSEKYRVNPFDIPDPSAEPSNQKIKSLLAVVETMVSEDDKTKLPKLDRALLEKAIIELYKSHRNHGEVPTVSTLAKYLSDFEETSMRAISKMLYLWTGERPYGKLLDGPGSLRTDASICTFDLKDLSSYPDLQSVMVLILTDFILSQVEVDRTQKKRIILDEAWALLKSQAAAGFMEYCARTLRKTGSGITFITQGVEEIVASAIGPAILNNTATKFIMLQRGDTEILKNALKLNTQEIALIHSLEQRKGEYSEGFLIEGDRRQVVRVYPSPFEYWLSTSDAQDNNYLDQLRGSGLTLVKAIKQAAVDFPNGIAVGRKDAA
jgi:type-IV secretion system protein TraC